MREPKKEISERERERERERDKKSDGWKGSRAKLRVEARLIIQVHDFYLYAG